MDPAGRDTFVWMQNGEPPGLYCADESDGEALRACEQMLESLLAYPEDSAGGLMNADVIQIRADVKVSTVLRYLRLLEKLPPQTDMLMVVDRKGHYQGGLRLSNLGRLHLGGNIDTRYDTNPTFLPQNQVGDLALRLLRIVERAGVRAR